MNHRELPGEIARSIVESHPANHRPGIVIVIIANEMEIGGGIEVDCGSCGGASITPLGGDRLIQLSQAINAAIQSCVVRFAESIGSVAVDGDPKGPPS